ncbi:hypothetical protein EVAR_5770_1 [Eumeta japonica]|uniref:Uncharacterized protein n=1 Tax=Eumeta variegata TaxID=151549 RepID=A0A4C1T7T1_EUMVA|nr:hypothetical protein EVAR_5770_1 [Eumeta japonica]
MKVVFDNNLIPPHILEIKNPDRQTDRQDRRTDNEAIVQTFLLSLTTITHTPREANERHLAIGAGVFPNARRVRTTASSSGRDRRKLGPFAFQSSPRYPRVFMFVTVNTAYLIRSM